MGPQRLLNRAIQPADAECEKSRQEQNLEAQHRCVACALGDPREL
jgi:hypothetical protein